MIWAVPAFEIAATLPVVPINDPRDNPPVLMTVVAVVPLIIDPAVVPSETTSDCCAIGIFVAVAMVVLATFVEACVMKKLVIPAEPVPIEDNPVKPEAAWYASCVKATVLDAVNAETAARPPDDKALAAVGETVKAVIEADWARLSIAP